MTTTLQCPSYTTRNLIKMPRNFSACVLRVVSFEKASRFAYLDASFLLLRGTPNLFATRSKTLPPLFPSAANVVALSSPSRL